MNNSPEDAIRAFGREMEVAIPGVPLSNMGPKATAAELGLMNYHVPIERITPLHPHRVAEIAVVHAALPHHSPDKGTAFVIPLPLERCTQKSPEQNIE